MSKLIRWSAWQACLFIQQHRLDRAGIIINVAIKRTISDIMVLILGMQFKELSVNRHTV